MDMKNAAPLPSYSGLNLLLKYLEMCRRRGELVPLADLPADFDEFVAPLNEGLPRPPERVRLYLKQLQEQGLAIIELDQGGGEFVGLTEVGFANACGIGLDPVLASRL